MRSHTNALAECFQQLQLRGKTVPDKDFVYILSSLTEDYDFLLTTFELMDTTLLTMEYLTGHCYKKNEDSQLHTAPYLFLGTLPILGIMPVLGTVHMLGIVPGRLQQKIQRKLQTSIKHQMTGNMQRLQIPVRQQCEWLIIVLSVSQILSQEGVPSLRRSSKPGVMSQVSA